MQQSVQKRPEFELNAIRSSKMVSFHNAIIDSISLFLNWNKLLRKRAEQLFIVAADSIPRLLIYRPPSREQQ